MPKSKRAKVVHLSKTDKKGKELNIHLADKIREAADQYEHIFVFSVNNMRNTYLKSVRSEFSDSRMFFGKTKVMAIALGLNRENEHLPNLYKLSSYLAGNVGLLFTSREPSDVISYFEGYSQTDYARAGVKATHTFTVPAGTVYSRGGEISAEDDLPLPHSLEPDLRKWGMPTRLVKGKITLEAPHTICNKGKILNSHQTALLKQFGVAMAEFRIRVKAYYSKSTEEITEVDSAEEEMDDEEELDPFEVDGVADVEMLPPTPLVDDIAERKSKRSKYKSII